MLQISAVIKELKNQLSSDSCWILLLELDTKIEGLEPIRVARNNEDIAYRGNTYIAFPLEPPTISEDTTGSIPSFGLSIDNTSRAATWYMEEGEGAIGGIVKLMVINTSAIDEDPVLEEEFKVQKAVVNDKFIKLTLSVDYYINSRRPVGRFMKNNCNFKYKGLRCAATSDLPECDHTLTACRERKNSARFGGYPGIDQKGVYV